MKQLFIAFVSGCLFGAGLLISRMSDPAKVLNFLNIAEQWDPSLALVIAGALPLAAAGYAIARSMPRALDGSCFPSLPRGRHFTAARFGRAHFWSGMVASRLLPRPRVGGPTSSARASRLLRPRDAPWAVGGPAFQYEARPSGTAIRHCKAKP